MEDSKRIQNNGGIISVPNNEEFPYKHGVGTALFEKMLEHQTKIAQINAETGEEDTYKSFLQRCIRTAITMRSKGITSKDIITVCSSNHLNTCVPLIATLFLGAKYANTDSGLSLSDTAFLLNQIRPKMIFASPNAVKLIEDALNEIQIVAEIVVFDDSTKHTPFSNFLVASSEEATFKPTNIVDVKETAAIFFSSGTSGFPKGICLTHMSLLASTLSLKAPPVPPVLLTYSSAYWLSLTFYFIFGVFLGGCRVVSPSFDCTMLWKYLEKYKVSFLMLTPTQVATVCQYGRPEGVDTSSLISSLAGGSPISKEQIETMRKLFPGTFFVTGYGQTELGSLIFTFDIASPEEVQLAFQKPTSCGRPVSGISAKVVDPDTGKILGPNQQGELLVKTKYAMNGYYNLDSSSVWDADGFIRTGDIAYYDEDYCFYIVDRIKEMLKFQGWQIAPARLEAILITHPAVECAVVVGLPDPVDGDHPVGVVVLGKSFVGKVTPEEIKKYFEERVNDKQKLRGGVKIVTAIPVTPTGKFKRRDIRDMILAGKI